MENFIYFVNNFIDKERQARWLGFAKKGNETIKTHIHQLENHLKHQYCQVIEKNTDQFIQAKILEHNLSSAILINFEHQETFMQPIDLDKICSPCLLICKAQQIAFYVHHSESWIYFLKK